MRTTIAFQEIKDYISKFTNKKFDISCVTTDTIRISYKIKVWIMEKDVDVDIKVLNIEGNNVFLSYGGSFAADLLVEPFIKIVKHYIPEKTDLVQQMDSNTLKISLDKIDKMEKVLEYMDLKSISFDTDNVILDVALK